MFPSAARTNENLPLYKMDYPKKKKRSLIEDDKGHACVMELPQVGSTIILRHSRDSINYYRTA